MMYLLIRSTVTLLLVVAAMAPAARVATSAAPGTITETVTFTFLTPSLGWRTADRWNANSGTRGPLRVDRTIDGGLTWHHLAVVTAAGRAENGLFNVYAGRILFANARDGWLYGNQLYATHDGGHTWRRLPLRGSGTELTLAGSSIWRLDSSCAGTPDRCRTTLLTARVGNDRWQVMNWHPLSLGAGTSTLARAGQQQAWLIGGPMLANDHEVLRLEATTDGAKSWRSLSMPCNRPNMGANSAQLVPYTAANLWLVCASEPGAGEQFKSIFRSMDGGHSWRLVAESGRAGHAIGTFPIGGYLGSVAVTTPFSAWVALARGTLMHSSDGGRTWRAAIPYATANPGDGGVGPVQFVDPRHGWLLSFPGLLFRTTDGGRHWHKIELSD